MNYDKAWWTVFVVFFVGTAFAETLLPLRPLRSSTPRRWINNSVLLLVSTLVVDGAYQLTGVALAFASRADAYGVLNIARLPYWFRFLAGFAALDLTAYLSHRLLHAVGPLWRLHQVHHSETDLDLVSGFRFHPAEALYSQAWRLLCIVLIGVPPSAVGCFALVVIAVDFITHANLRVPGGGDRVLRSILVTPSMHRTHHAEEIAMQRANFGTVFSLWDRLLGTYLPRLRDEERMRFGLAEYSNGSSLGVMSLLWMPFRRPHKEQDTAVTSRR